MPAIKYLDKVRKLPKGKEGGGMSEYRKAEYILEECCGCPFYTDFSLCDNADSHCEYIDKPFMYPESHFPDFCPLEKVSIKEKK
jgi:hypothetical protein